MLGWRGWDWAGEGAPSLHSSKGPILLLPCSPRSHPCPPAPCQGSGKRCGHPARNRLCPPASSLPRGTFVHLLQPSSAERTKEPSGMRGGWGGMLGSERALTPPPHTPSSQQHPGAGRQLERAVPAPGSPPRPPPRAPSSSSSLACVATPAWMGPAPTSGSRSGSWRAPSERPAWTPEVGGSAGAPRGCAGWVHMCGWGAGGAGWVCPPSPALCPPGSPKRRQFQRQRAASESMDQEDRDPHQTDIIQYIAHTDDVAFHPAGGPFLPSPASPPPSLGRYFSVDKRGRGWVSRAPGRHRGTPRCPEHGGLLLLRLWWGNRVWGEGSGGAW